MRVSQFEGLRREPHDSANNRWALIDAHSHASAGGDPDWRIHRLSGDGPRASQACGRIGQQRKSASPHEDLPFAYGLHARMLRHNVAASAVGLHTSTDVSKLFRGRLVSREGRMLTARE